jgi:hypothetical protein
MMVNIIDKGIFKWGKRVWGCEEEDMLLITLSEEDYKKLEKYPLYNRKGNKIDFISFIERLGIKIKSEN